MEEIVVGVQPNADYKRGARPAVLSTGALSLVWGAVTGSAVRWAVTWSLDGATGVQFPFYRYGALCARGETVKVSLSAACLAFVSRSLFTALAACLAAYPDTPRGGGSRLY
ncbi:hypothetical protein ElyMa_005101900 [Elysia marginata]|uniref:Uncharacterized protein n=1 Tax=Elysia marginata TaxID=1093978 RepID=A0AAV4JKB9_9GAST|nr:hypothetical protein ElyMa_005101900 [Elysia marginata]